MLIHSSQTGEAAAGLQLQPFMSGQTLARCRALPSAVSHRQDVSPPFPVSIMAIAP